jgi:hypothetical protein
LGKLRLVRLTCQLILSSYTKSTSVTSHQSANDIFLSQQILPVPKKQIPPVANNIFLSKQTSHQQLASSTFLPEQTNTGNQPPVKRTGHCLLISIDSYISQFLVG